MFSIVCILITFKHHIINLINTGHKNLNNLGDNEGAK